MPATAALASPGPALNWAELLSHRAYLLRFAQRKLQDPALAEDVVHDVFEAVLRGRAAFAGASALRTWLTGVLKHKIVDLVRQRRAMLSLDDAAEDAETLALECPQPRPDELAEQRERLHQTLQRIDALPSGLRDVVRLRVLHDQPTEAVCQALQITEENLFVRLHRARKQLLS
ncbi:MAG: sigma-70 family polymerase sigma factor [Proteobacteria bacterium]|nr:sigma-70 family polymerase sigma factor [Pseudomonadota bacterium]